VENLLQNIIFQGYDVTSGFSRVFCPGANKIQGFQGLPGFVGHLDYAMLI